MVLHNNKWDRRAKHKYLKKHGLTAEEAKKNKLAQTTDEIGDDPRGTESVQQQAESSHDLKASSQDAGENELDVEGGVESTDSPTTHGLGEAAIDLYPEIESDEEEQALIRKHIANTQFDPETKSHVIRGDKDMFDAASAGVQRSRLNRDVRERIGAKARSRGTIDLESDSDFEDFMDNLGSDASENEEGSAHQAVDLATPGEGQSIDETKHDFLDKLLH